MKPFKVLMSAYACEPGLGSEPGIGWNWVEQAAHVSQLWVITRANNRDAIERYLTHEPLSDVKWVYVDLPYWLRWWKKGGRGFRLYYCLWQIASYRAAKRLHSAVVFDCVHHVTIGAYWMATFLSALPVPFVWGPVGGAEAAPKSFYRSFSLRGRVHEHLRDAMRCLSRFRPAVRFTAQRARIVLATTDETKQQLRRLGAREVQVLSHAALSTGEFERFSALPIRTSRPFRVISIGRLLHWKGCHLSLRAFTELQRTFPDSEYWLIGVGPERKRLERLAMDLGIADSVRFLGTLPRDAVMETLAASDVLIHPSFHDSGGYVCIEAMAAGRPVICLDLGGPGLLVTPESGIKVPARTPEQATEGLADAMLSMAADNALRYRLGVAARRRIGDYFLWDRNGATLAGLYLLIQNESRAVAGEPFESS